MASLWGPSLPHERAEPQQLGWDPRLLCHPSAPAVANSPDSGRCRRATNRALLPAECWACSGTGEAGLGLSPASPHPRAGGQMAPAQPQGRALHRSGHGEGGKAPLPSRGGGNMAGTPPGERTESQPQREPQGKSPTRPRSCQHPVPPCLTRAEDSPELPRGEATGARAWSGLAGLESRAVQRGCHARCLHVEPGCGGDNAVGR